MRDVSSLHLELDLSPGARIRCIPGQLDGTAELCIGSNIIISISRGQADELTEALAGWLEKGSPCNQ